MKKWICLTLTALLLLLGTTALCESTAVTMTDMTGREITLPAPATRIVALSAADCEILYAMGAQDVIVGRGEYCDYPEDVLALPIVNSGAQTNVEQLIALAPQVVVMSKMAQTIEQGEALRNAGIEVVISDAQDIAGVYQAIDMLGALTGKNKEAATLTAKMQDAFAALSASTDQNAGKTVYFEVSPLQWGLWTAGTGTFMNELAAMCGVRNAFDDVTGWAAISEEQVLARDPDFIVTITMYGGSGQTPVDEIKSRSGWEYLKAVQNNAILNASSNEISRPGPRLIEAVQALSAFFSAR